MQNLWHGICKELGVHFFSVSNIDEATALRDDQIQGDILILGYTPVEQAEELVKYNIIQTVFSPEFAQELNLAAQKLVLQSESMLLWIQECPELVSRQPNPVGK